jgi:hypothetical protein
MRIKSNPFTSITGFYCNKNNISVAALPTEIKEILSPSLLLSYIGVVVYQLTHVCLLPARCNPVQRAESESALATSD